MKAVVISQPKAGTYLAANLIQYLGMDFSHIHIDPGMYRIFKNNDLKNFERFGGGVSKAVSNLKDNQFAVGHIPFVKQNKQALKDFKKILVIRDIQEIIESAKRYKEEKDQDVETIINASNLKNIAQWSKEEDVFVMNFADMISENSRKINEMQMYLFDHIKTDSLWAIRQAKIADSLTKSSIR
jgi:hypothetical protein